MNDETYWGYSPKTTDTTETLEAKITNLRNLPAESERCRDLIGDLIERCYDSMDDIYMQELKAWAAAVAAGAAADRERT